MFFGGGSRPLCDVRRTSQWHPRIIVQLGVGPAPQGPQTLTSVIQRTDEVVQLWFLPCSLPTMSHRACASRSPLKPRLRAGQLRVCEKRSALA